MKTCTKCGTSKSIDKFYTQSDRKRGSSYCKECKNAYDVARWIDKKKRAVVYKGSYCTHCGKDYPYPAMHFHHRDPLTKDCNWVQLRLRSWSKITEELDKCDLLCANCHAIHHSALSS